jgi:hypothetical protein
MVQSSRVVLSVYPSSKISAPADSHVYDYGDLRDNVRPLHFDFGNGYFMRIDWLDEMLLQIPGNGAYVKRGDVVATARRTPRWDSAILVKVYTICTEFNTPG